MGNLGPLQRRLKKDVLLAITSTKLPHTTRPPVIKCIKGAFVSCDFKAFPWRKKNSWKKHIFVKWKKYSPSFGLKIYQKVVCLKSSPKVQGGIWKAKSMRSVKYLLSCPTQMPAFQSNPPTPHGISLIFSNMYSEKEWERPSYMLATTSHVMNTYILKTHSKLQGFMSSSA